MKESYTIEVSPIGVTILQMGLNYLIDEEDLYPTRALHAKNMKEVLTKALKKNEKEKMEENKHQNNLNELEEMSDFLKGVVDFGKKFESIRQTKPKEDKPQTTHSSPWVSAKDTEGLKEGVEYLVRRFARLGIPIYSTAIWSKNLKQFYLKDGSYFPVIVDHWMEIPE